MKSQTPDASRQRRASNLAICLGLRVGAAIVGLALGDVAGFAAEEIVVGASIPLSGPLAGFGSFQQWGYKRAIDEANKAGGITVEGKKRNVRLILRDDRTDPNVTASNTETLISRDHVTAMLGSCTPVLVNAGALVAERHRIPLVTACDPLEAFKSVRKWNYAWDLFFHEPDLASTPFRMLEDLKVQTNKRVAILHDNGPDGQVVGGQIWPEVAKSSGYEVVQNSSFPIDNTQFTSLIAEAKSKSADIVLADAITPQAVAMRKQMASANFTPKVLVIEKGGEPVQFAQALGKLSDGILVGGYWDPSFPYPGAADLAKAFEKETGQTSSQHIADSYAAAQVLLDAIAAAASADAEKINQAIARTDKTYVVGPVKFDENHTSKLPIVEDQWRAGNTAVVWPSERATGKFLFPLP
jgi:branched-chain amino acid transport system substrate-binding protein